MLRLGSAFASTLTGLVLAVLSEVAVDVPFRPAQYLRIRLPMAFLAANDMGLRLRVRASGGRGSGCVAGRGLLCR